MAEIKDFGHNLTRSMDIYLNNLIENFQNGKI